MAFFKNMSIQKREALAAYAYISPWLIGFLVFTLGPMIASLYFSFSEYDMIAAPQWIGGRNYVNLFQDPLFWQSLKVTLYFAALSLPLSLIFGLSILAHPFLRSKAAPGYAKTHACRALSLPHKPSSQAQRER